MLYRDFDTREQIDAQYDIRRSVEDPEPLRARFQTLNEAARRLPDVRLGVSYGDDPDEHVDIYPAGEGSPVLVFIHGGYWRASSAREHGFVALGPHAHGVSVVVTNYSLCPDVRLPKILEQNRAALDWVREQAPSFAGRRDRIVLAGHSAGAQQVALLLASEGATGLVGGIGLSGIYDLRPLRHSFLQPKLRLDSRLEIEQSPRLNVPSASPPLILMVGREESEEFVRQTRSMHRAWSEAGLPVGLREQPGLNHYTSAAQWADADSLACAELAGLLERAERLQEG